MKKKNMRTKSRSSTPDSQPLTASPTLLVATHNSGKVEEIRMLLGDLNLAVRDLTQLPGITEIEETGTTFLQNALMKAHYYQKQTGLLTLADDSGLEVAALGEAPGIYSARYAGPHATDSQRITKLIDELSEVPNKDRTARFVCVLALVGPNQLEKTFTGVCEGRIMQSPLGDEGFGFDPVFEYPPLGKTFAQLSREEKSAVSHRGRAVQQLRQFLVEWVKQLS